MRTVLKLALARRPAPTTSSNASRATPSSPVTARVQRGLANVPDNVEVAAYATGTIAHAAPVGFGPFTKSCASHFALDSKRFNLSVSPTTHFDLSEGTNEHSCSVCEDTGDDPRPVEIAAMLRNTVETVIDVTAAVVRDVTSLDPSDEGFDTDLGADGVGVRELTITQRGDGTLDAELCSWWHDADPNEDPPDVVHFGRLERLAPTLRRAGVTAAAIVRNMIAAGEPMSTVQLAAKAMA